MLPPFVWSDDCLRHEPQAEVWVGVRTPATEVPARASAIRGRCSMQARRRSRPSRTTTPRCSRCTTRRSSSILRTAWDEWSAASLPSDRVVPYVFAREELTSGRAPAPPAAVWARPGLFAYDTMTLIGPGTWEAARAAVDVALTAVDLVADGAPDRLRVLPAAGPPRHPLALRRLLLPQQHRDRRSRAARPARCAGRRRRRRRPSRQRDAGALPRPHRRASRPRCTSTREPAGSRTSSASQRENDEANLNVPLAPGTGDERLARGGPRGGDVRRRAHAHSSSPSASMPLPATRRARSR